MKPDHAMPVLKWSERVSPAMLWAIGAMLVTMDAVLGGLALANWRTPHLSVQVLGLLTLLIGFAVTIGAGHLSLRHAEPLARSPYLAVMALCAATAWLCLQYMEREVTEETGDRRRLEELEAEYLELAVQYGKREELLRVLERKDGRLRLMESMQGRLAALRGQTAEAVQYALDQVTQALGKGEPEVILHTDRGIARHARGAAPVESPGGRDEIDHWMAEHRTALLVSNLANDVRFTNEFGRVRKIQSMVAVPLYREGTMAGSLRLTSAAAQAFSHDDLRFVSEAAELLRPVLFGGAPLGPLSG